MASPLQARWMAPSGNLLPRYGPLPLIRRLTRWTNYLKQALSPNIALAINPQPLLEDHGIGLISGKTGMTIAFPSSTRPPTFPEAPILHD
jgi:hypothetical protein